MFKLFIPLLLTACATTWKRAELEMHAKDCQSTMFEQTKSYSFAMHLCVCIEKEAKTSYNFKEFYDTDDTDNLKGVIEQCVDDIGERFGATFDGDELFMLKGVSELSSLK